MVAHSALTGADLHEVKGAAAASANTILKADGAGSASFVLPTTLTNVSVTSILSNSNTADITPVVVDTPIDATFSGTVSNSDVTMDASGLITVNTSGVYHVTFNLNFSRTAGAGTAILAARLLVNGSQFGFTQSVVQPDSVTARPVQITIIKPFTAADNMKVQIIRDSAGINNGHLDAQAITLADWGDVPSYWVRVAKWAGAGA